MLAIIILILGVILGIFAFILLLKYKKIITMQNFLINNLDLDLSDIQNFTDVELRCYYEKCKKILDSHQKVENLKREIFNLNKS